MKISSIVLLFVFICSVTGSITYAMRDGLENSIQVSGGYGYPAGYRGSWWRRNYPWGYRYFNWRPYYRQQRINRF